MGSFPCEHFRERGKVRMEVGFWTVSAEEDVDDT
jgi:hypothetical protein